MSVEFKIGDDKANNKSLAAERSQQEEENPDENDHHRIKRQQQQRKNPSLKSSAPSVKFHEIVATDTGRFILLLLRILFDIYAYKILNIFTR
jgi:hypothetical protein